MAFYQLSSRIPLIIAQAEQGVRAQMQGAARRIALDMQSNAPVDSGDLAGSIHEVELDDGFGVECALHGIFLERGTSRMAARPWIAPVAQAEEATFNAAMARIYR